MRYCADIYRIEIKINVIAKSVKDII